MVGSSVASSVGRMVLLAVGIEDGKIVTKYEGYTEGDALEISLGDDDVITDGLALGSFDDEDMEPSDGKILGDKVEIMDGPADGIDDGETDGLALGTNDGEDMGSSDGEVLGDDVGIMDGPADGLLDTLTLGVNDGNGVGR